MISSGFIIKKFNVIGSIISIILIIGYVVWIKLNPTTRRQAILDDAQKEMFYGKVDSIYRDKEDHNIQKVHLTSGYVYGLYPEWEDKVEKGDSLSKKKGSLIVIVIKQNGSRINFNYQELVKDIKE